MVSVKGIITDEWKPLCSTVKVEVPNPFTYTGRVSPSWETVVKNAVGTSTEVSH